MINTKISWCTHSWNPWQGCTHKSEGCDNCYARRRAERYGVSFVPHSSSEATWNLPRSKKVRAGDSVFVCSLSDFFIPAPGADMWRNRALDIIEDRPDVTFLILSKRAWSMSYWAKNIREFPPNVWVGVTIESGTRAERAKVLIDTPVPSGVRFVSAEPLIEPLALSAHLGPDRISWLIVGGESGPKAREMQRAWVEELSDEANEAKIPFFFKQWGAASNETATFRKDKPACRL